jgi:hypothetical protein
MATTTKRAAAKTTSAKSKPAQSKRRPSSAAAAKSKPTPTAQSDVAQRRRGGTTSTVERTEEHKAMAARATELLRSDGTGRRGGSGYTNASGVSAGQIADFAKHALKGANTADAALDVLGGGRKLTKPAALKLATGESAPTAEQKAAWRSASKRYSAARFGAEVTTQNKLTGRKVACVLYALAYGGAK